LNWQYQYPQALWLLTGIALFLLLFLGYLLWKRRSVKRIGDPRLVKSLMGNHSSLLSSIRFFIILLAFALGCLALANPRKPDEASDDVRKGIDLVIALDISNSMLATDLAPDRLTRARQLVNRLTSQLPNDRIGLVIFAGNAYVQVPLTFDHGAVNMAVTTAHPSLIGEQGTAISDALQKCMLSFEDKDRFRSILLITDGETHDDDALQTAEATASRGVMINTIGIGSPQGATITDPATGQPRQDAGGQVVISRLNEQVLQQLAAAGKGKYQLLESTDDAVKGLKEQFSGIEGKALADTSLFTYHSFYTWLALPMLVLLLSELFIPNYKRRSRS
jgi:Ca-activated chloride channel homolog